MVKDHLQIIPEDINSKFNVVIECYNALDRKIDNLEKRHDERFDLLDFKIETVNNHLSKKIDAVAADLKAHRADTEAHGNIYRVRES
ncbi:hypothetical protein [Pelovirga terrestris]|uniref:Uncharacterized protein n=1 Tax=Pelovirga terrestris TaxID=2771352 RepID=A0A8J6QNB8_9BACT|nr:hypothetical protein [Pelovirga terrestris]MBD1399401.1 hypothetical protein [Pelovirga terrestris]